MTQLPQDPSELKAARRAAKISREDLADRAGIAVTTVWRLETGRHAPRPSRWAWIVQALQELRPGFWESVTS